MTVIFSPPIDAQPIADDSYQVVFMARGEGRSRFLPPTFTHDCRCTLDEYGKKISCSIIMLNYRSRRINGVYNIMYKTTKRNIDGI